MCVEVKLLTGKEFILLLHCFYFEAIATGMV
jgi:hypothetical protein